MFVLLGKHISVNEKNAGKGVLAFSFSYIGHRDRSWKVLIEILLI